MHVATRIKSYRFKDNLLLRDTEGPLRETLILENQSIPIYIYERPYRVIFGQNAHERIWHTHDMYHVFLRECTHATSLLIKIIISTTGVINIR